MGPLSEEQIGQLRRVLPLIARWFAEGRDSCDSAALSQILARAGVSEAEWALTAATHISQVVAKAAGTSIPERRRLVSELESLGFSNAQALLTIDSAAHRNRVAASAKETMAKGVLQHGPPLQQSSTHMPTELVVSPPSVNFGSLGDGGIAIFTLEVRGEVIEAISPDQRLRATVARHRGDSLVRLSVGPGRAGDQLSVSLVLVGHRGQVLVPITVGWNNQRRRAVLEPSASPQLRECPLCGRKSLLWDKRAGKFTCLNVSCLAQGRTIDTVRRGI